VFLVNSELLGASLDMSAPWKLLGSVDLQITTMCRELDFIAFIALLGVSI
jgi:hypothetical protein